MILHASAITYNGHGPIWSIHDQTQSKTNNEGNLVSYRDFHIKQDTPYHIDDLAYLCFLSVERVEKTNNYEEGEKVCLDGRIINSDG